MPSMLPDRPMTPESAREIRRRAVPCADPRGVVVAVLLVFIAALGCASGRSRAPETAARPKRTVLLTTADDTRVGADAAREVARDVGLFEDPVLSSYVDGVGRKVLRALERREFAYRFSIVDEMEPNAFALPGGHIFVSRGLLALINDEDELACILGHEITHVALRHTAMQQAIARQLPFGLPVTRQAQMAAYGRDMERDADAMGQRLCAAVGYDPAAMARFLRSLDGRDRLLIGHPRTATFLDTHPGSGERAAVDSMRASELRWERDRSLGDVRERYLDRVDGLPIGDRPQTGVFLDSLFVHPELGFQIAFPKGWQVRNSARAVGATSPRGDAAIVLVGDLPSGELVEIAEAFVAQAAREHGARIVRRQRVRLMDAEALRYSLEAGSDVGGVRAEITFFPFAGGTWRLVGVAPRAAADRVFATMLPSIRSFARLSQENRARAEMQRLRVVLARSGETIAELSERAQCVLPPAATALLNGWLGDEVLEGDDLVKVVRRETEPRP